MIREYNCPKCNTLKERIVKLDNQDEQYCETHPEIKLERIHKLSAVPVKFKGPFH